MLDIMLGQLADKFERIKKRRTRKKGIKEEKRKERQCEGGKKGRTP